MIEYNTVSSDQHLKQILQLQKENLETSISREELKKEGFVTVNHSFELLKEMNHPYPHIIALDQSEVIGYTLVMLRSMEAQIPILVPMFEQINDLFYQGMQLINERYFIMGQVCIKKNYRGKGIFKGLYNHMKKVMSPHFKYIITEVAHRNQRSLKAHIKVGFQIIHTYQAAPNETWDILLWDWNNEI